MCLKCAIVEICTISLLEYVNGATICGAVTLHNKQYDFNLRKGHAEVYDNWDKYLPNSNVFLNQLNNHIH